MTHWKQLLHDEQMRLQDKSPRAELDQAATQVAGNCGACDVSEVADERRKDDTVALD